MLEFLLECAGDLIESVGEFIGELFGEAGEVVSTINIGDVIATTALLGGAITVASLTESVIRNELSKRQELKNKGVTHAIVQDFVQSNGYTEITLAALNAQNQQVGTVKMKAQSSYVKKGDKIQL
ncbi:MAG: hypothetical protein E7075_06710 [Bacteroidales bacterium]|nr:hypothetical protein [Bacteroidales bacterium]